jgi:hypothetical protein
MYPSFLLYSFEQIFSLAFPRPLRIIDMPLPRCEIYACLVHLE